MFGLRLELALLLGCLLSACAHIVDPTGGPKDEKAPVVVSIFPKPNSTKVQPREVIITFDEYLKVGSASDQVFISPVPNRAPFITIQGKQLRIAFQEPLLEQTTYSITVASGIRDFTEGNQIQEPFQMAFSTGSALDTIQCLGSLHDNVTGTPLTGWNVGLFKPVHGDSVAAYLGSRPIYLTRTNLQGKYTLANLKQGEYLLLAYKDKDQNSAPDSLEPIALSRSPMPVLLPADTTFQLDLVPISPQIPISARIENVATGMYKIEFSRPCVLSDSTFLVFPSDSTGSVVGESLPVACQKGGKVVIAFMQDFTATHLFIPTVLDSTGNVHQLISRLPDQKSSKVLSPKLLLVKYLPDLAEIQFSHPVDPSSRLLPPLFVRGNSICVPNQQRDTLQVVIPAGTRFLQCTDTLKRDTVLRLPVALFPQTGSARITIVPSIPPSLIAWLQAADGTVVPGSAFGNTLTFNKVMPGKYFLYLLDDADRNGVRTLPSLRNLPLEHPETMLRHPTPIEIRPNWDLEGIKVSIPW